MAQEKTFVIRDDFIKLGQLLKAAGAVDSGLEAKLCVTSGEVKVNGETELRRGRKMICGDVAEYKDIRIKVEK